MSDDISNRGNIVCPACKAEVSVSLDEGEAQCAACRHIVRSVLCRCSSSFSARAWRALVQRRHLRPAVGHDLRRHRGHRRPPSPVGRPRRDPHAIPETNEHMFGARSALIASQARPAGVSHEQARPCYGPAHIIITSKRPHNGHVARFPGFSRRS